MNTKRTIFWIGFVVVLGLIIWGLIVAMNKPVPAVKVGPPAPVSSTDNVLGSTTAPVTLIAYEDFQCPACAVYYPLVERVFNEASTTMRVVFRHFPLTQHKNAIPAALAAEAAGKQGKFWEMYRILYDQQVDWSDVPDTGPLFSVYAERLGLDASQFKADQQDPELKSKILSQQDEGIRIGVNQTPTFFVNDVMVSPQNYEEFKAIIDAAATGGSN